MERFPRLYRIEPLLLVTDAHGPGFGMGCSGLKKVPLLVVGVPDRLTRLLFEMNVVLVGMASQRLTSAIVSVGAIMLLSAR